MKKLIIITGTIIINCSILFSQEKQNPISLNGYVTTMQSVIFDSLSGKFLNDNLLHNRLNFKANIKGHLTFAAEFRDRKSVV